jgi:hypothetical protein
VRAVYLDTPLETALARNEAREGRARVPLVGVFSTRARLVPPSVEEGFAAVERVGQAAGPVVEVRGRGSDAVSRPEGSRAHTCLRPGPAAQP